MLTRVDSAAADRRPLVTVVICVYNAGKYFRPSLQSVLDQTYQNLEIIVIDDGSTDGCIDTAADLLSEKRVRLHRQSNATKPVALNRALNLMTGEFYAIQDADDISHPRRIERQLQAMLDDPRLAAVFCGNELILDDRTIAPVFAPKGEAACRRDVEAFRMPAHDPTGMFRMALVGDLRYEPSLQVAETFDYILRVGERHPMIVLGECLYGYRILPNSLTRRAPSWREQFVTDALRRACERRGQTLESTCPDRLASERRSHNSRSDNNIAAHFMNSVIDQRQAANRLAALKTGLDCARLHPFDLHYYKALIYALVPLGLLTHLRRTALITSLGTRP